MPGYLSLKFISYHPVAPGTLAFDLAIVQTNRRTAHILSTEFELWFGHSNRQFLCRLGPDITTEMTGGGAQFVVELKDEAARTGCRLLWHYSPDQLQRIDESRNGGKAILYIYARFTVQAIWPRPKENPIVNYEIETPGSENGWPLRIEIAESDWIALLSDIGFRHPAMDRITWPLLPPAFSRAEGHLNDAWLHYRRAEPAPALAACYKAFECLGFDLFGKEVQRKDVLDLLMGSAELTKQEAVLSLLRSLQCFFQFGRHDKGAPVKLTQNDAQMAVVCATVLLAYLAPTKQS
jgi:hypothetical protein